MADEPWLARIRYHHGGGGFCQCPVCDVPDLIDEIDRLRAELETARQQGVYFQKVIANQSAIISR